MQNMRISIRAGEYRGLQGFKVNAGAGRNIFCPTRAQAEAYRDMLKANLPREEEYRRSYQILCEWPGLSHVARGG